MLRYHHVGIPTAASRPGERYVPQGRCWVSGYETSAYGVEWMRFEGDSPVPELVRSVPHVAFEVDDLGSALAGKRVIIPPNRPSDGVIVAFIEENGAPIEFLQFVRDS